MTSIHSEHSDLNDDRSVILETRLSDIQIREYDDTLKLLAESNSLTYNYALEETIRLMENLVGRPKEDLEDKKVVNFAFKAAGYLSNYEWTYYDNSTIAQLEFFLHAMSSVLHILSKSIQMIDSNTRNTFYKSISKFWGIYRNTSVMNANVMFSLREIRNCLRKIKDDKSRADTALKVGGNVFDIVVSVAQKEYFAAFGSFIKILDFEYSAGEWYYEWIIRREKFLLLCSQNSSDSKSVRRFYRKLFKLSKKEFAKVKRKNTRYRKFEYKMLKSGGMVGGYSLPDNIDTLLLGYLQLILKLFEHFPLQLKKYSDGLVSFCKDIVETHVKKQLTFKAIEILYYIKESLVNDEIKKEIELNFESWSTYHLPPTTRPRPLSAPPSFHYGSSQNKPNKLDDIIISSLSNESFQSNIPPDTPVSAYTSFSSPPNTPSRTLTPLSQEENPKQEEETPKQEEKSKQRRKIKVREIPKKVTRSLSNLQQQCTRKRMIEDVKRLFEERNKIQRDIEQIKEHYDELLVKEEDDKVYDKNSDDFSNSILSKLNEILEEKRNDTLSPSLPQIPFVSEPEQIIYNNYETKNIYYSQPEIRTREIIYIVSDNNKNTSNKDVNNSEMKEESKKIEDIKARGIEESDKNEKVISKDVNNSEIKEESKKFEDIETREIEESDKNGEVICKDVNNSEVKEESKKIEDIKTCDIVESNKNEEVVNKNINNPEDDVKTLETISIKENEIETDLNKGVDDPEEKEDDVKPPEPILTNEINEVEMNLKEEEDDVKPTETIVTREINEIEMIEEMKDDNLNVEENEKEECKERDEINDVIQSIKSFDSHPAEEEIKKDNTDVEENEKEECRKNEENNDDVIQSINSHSEVEELKKDDNNINVEVNEKEGCIKSDDGESVHSNNESVNPSGIILSHSEDSEIKGSNDSIIENIVTINQINQINIVQNVQPPPTQDDYEDSVFLKTVKKIVKEVENIVDKAAKAHREAVLRSSTYINETKESEEIIEKEEIIEEIIEKEEIIEEVIEKEEIIEKEITEKESIEKETIEKVNGNEEVALKI
ncbi:hypothetical protein RclHR1_00250018 [Rhizophagus clarus]|uniref:Uncharacterized protein n=1 Tax=Rhizophagus clarus TaxID=94130 RepID=A0A2Z6QYV8_9GLOM|nr:hypothetical protein RclHR1_00250018 [Rhizophagus clarus]GET00992.1 hypothetical protein GLOIN_2v1841914 [Rhizophagus clarus]